MAENKDKSSFTEEDASKAGDKKELSASLADESHAAKQQENNPQEVASQTSTLPRKKKKKKKWKRWVVLAVIAAIIIFVIVRMRQGGANSVTYAQETAQKRDIVTYHSFTGTVEPVESRSLTTTVSGVKVLKVNYEKGDTVKKGDVIATLDTSSVEDQIAQNEATLDKTKKQSEEQIVQAEKSYQDLSSNLANGLDSSTNQAKNQIESAKSQLDSAKTQYENLKNNIDQNLDTSLQSAQNQMNSAFQQLLQAQQSYNNEVSLNNQQLSQTITSAQQQVDSAYNQLTSAQLSLSQAQQNRTHSEETFQAGMSGQSYDPTSYDQQVANAEQNLKQAQQNYETAKQSYAVAEQTEANSLTSLYDSVLTAQTSYLSAVDSYNATVNSLNQQLVSYKKSYDEAVTSYNQAIQSYNTTVNSTSQQLESYAQQVEQAKTSADQTASELQLQQLKDSLEDYEIVAPIDGELTELNLKEGEMLSAATTPGTVTDFSRMKLEIKISEYDIQGVTEGSPVTITLDALTGKSYEGTISYISHEATVSGGVSYFESEVQFDVDDDVRGGMSAEVRLTINDLKDVVTVSNDAIQTAADGTSYVLVQGNGQDSSAGTPGGMQQQTVETGATDGTYTQITSGLNEGDTVYYQASSGTETMMQMMQERGGGGGGNDDGGGQ